MWEVKKRANILQKRNPVWIGVFRNEKFALKFIRSVVAHSPWSDDELRNIGNFGAFKYIRFTIVYRAWYCLFWEKMRKENDVVREKNVHFYFCFSLSSAEKFLNKRFITHVALLAKPVRFWASESRILHLAKFATW